MAAHFENGGKHGTQVGTQRIQDADAEAPTDDRRGASRGLSLSFGVVWGSFVFLMLCLALLRPSASVVVFLVALHALISAISLAAVRAPIGYLLALALVSRFAVVWLDLYTGVRVINSGADAEMFHRVAMGMYNDPTLLSEPARSWPFTKTAAIIFLIGGPHRILVQYFNMLLGVSAIGAMEATMRNLDIPGKIGVTAVAVLTLMPLNATMVAIFLRESIPMFFVAASLYSFSVFLARGRAVGGLSAVVLLAVASIFHAGVIGLVAAYMLAFIFYDTKAQTLRFSAAGLFVGVPVAVVTLLVFTQFSDVLMQKFEGVEEISDLYSTAGRAAGGSAYLPVTEITTPSQLLKWGGIKALFFLSSPVPWQWRGGTDAITFLFDGAVYVGASFLVLAGLLRGKKGPGKTWLVILSIGLAVTVFTFGIGTHNAGTALRHRQKIVVPVLVSAALGASVLQDRTAPKPIEVACSVRRRQKVI